MTPILKQAYSIRVQRGRAATSDPECPLAVSSTAGSAADIAVVCALGARKHYFRNFPACGIDTTQSSFAGRPRTA
jgi:hypothetical protein